MITSRADSISSFVLLYSPRIHSPQLHTREDLTCGKTSIRSSSTCCCSLGLVSMISLTK